MRQIKIMSRKNNGEWHYRNKLSEANFSMREKRIDGQDATAMANSMIMRWQAVEPHTDFRIVWE